MRAPRPTLPRGPETRELRGMPKASSEADEMRTFASVIDVAAALIIADRCPVHRPHPLSTGVKPGRIIADVGKGVDGSPRGNALLGRGAPVRGRLAATGSGPSVRAHAAALVQANDTCRHRCRATCCRGRQAARPTITANPDAIAYQISRKRRCLSPSKLRSPMNVSVQFRRGLRHLTGRHYRMRAAGRSGLALPTFGGWSTIG